MKDNRISDEELLVTRDNKRYRTICRRIWYMPKNKDKTEVLAGNLKLDEVPEKL